MIFLESSALPEAEATLGLRPYRLLIVGPPGVGKGTQSELIGKRLRIPTLSTGEVFRHHLREKTPLGQRIENLVSRGDFVPDDLTNEVVISQLSSPEYARGFLLDGYPRTIAQAGFIDLWLQDRGLKLDLVLSLRAAREELLSRLLLRSQEQGRSDDTQEVISRRLEKYDQETQPVLEYYRQRDLVSRIDGLGTVEEVFARIVSSLNRI